MNRYPAWKYLIIAVSILLGLLYTLPNFYGESPAVQVSPLRTAAKADTALLQRVEDALKKANLAANGMFLELAASKCALPIPIRRSRPRICFSRCWVTVIW